VLLPQVALPLVGGSALGIYAALNIHTTLQFIGVLGVFATVINKALSYDSPAAALEDAKGAVGGVQKALSKLGSIKPPAGIKAPSLPSLPKMPAAAAGGGLGSSSSSGSNGRPAAAVGGSSAAAGAALSAAAVGGASGGRGDADVGEETETELVD
jgi:hypothetical protein